MLLGIRTLRPSAVLLAGHRLDPLARLRLGQMACDAQADLVHLTVEERAGETVMTDISIFVPRDRICFSHPGCRLWLSKTGSRALLLPHAHVRGSFRLARGEIIHLLSIAEANFGRDWMPWAGIGIPTAVMLWAAWRLGSSHAKLWIMSGASSAMSSGKWLALIACGLTLPANAFYLDVWLSRGWPWAALSAAAWGVQMAVDRVTIRSIAMESGAADQVQSL